MHIPGYTVQHEIGQGGMATVWLALRDTDHQPVAVKVLHANLASDASLVERFLDEGRTHARFVHDQIVRILDVAQLEDGRPFIVMEYLQGETFKDLLKGQGRISPADLQRLLLPVFSALGYIHAQGFVHRDIKPENIFVSQKRGPLLMDFGIARQVDRNTRFTEAGMAVGTPHYMSPEQARGEKTDHRTDLYALGVVIYEALTGRVPFDAADSFAIAIKHIQEVAAPLPADLAHFQPLIERTLTKSPADRYQNIETLAKDFELGLQGKLIPISTPPSATTVMPAAGIESRSPKKKKGGFVLAAGVVLALLLGGGAWFYMQRQPSRIRFVGGGGGSAPVSVTEQKPAVAVVPPVPPVQPQVVDPSPATKPKQIGGDDLAGLLAGNQELDTSRERLKTLHELTRVDLPAAVDGYFALLDKCRENKVLSPVRSEVELALNQAAAMLMQQRIAAEQLRSPPGKSAADLLRSWLATGLVGPEQKTAAAAGAEAYVALAAKTLDNEDESKSRHYLLLAKDFAAIVPGDGNRLLDGGHYAEVQGRLNRLKRQREKEQLQLLARKKQDAKNLEQVWEALGENTPWKAQVRLEALQNSTLSSSELAGAEKAVAGAINMRRMQADSFLAKAREAVEKSRFAQAIDFCKEARSIYPEEDFDLSICDEAKQKKAALVNSWAAQNQGGSLSFKKTK